MFQQLKPDPVEFWYNQNVFADGLVKLCRRFRFDGILVSLHGHSREWDKELERRELLEDGKQKLIFRDRIEIHSPEDLPFVTFRGNHQEPDIEEVDIERDIPSAIDYIPVSNNLHFSLDSDNLFEIFDLVYRITGDEFSIHGEITSPFDYFLDLLGHQNGLISMMIEPDKSKSILEKFAEGVKRIAVSMCDKQIDAIKISSPYAGMGFISSEQYQEFVLPFERSIIKAIRERGKHAYIHTCGSITDRLELMRESGASGLECLDPPPIGNVELEDAFHRVGDDLFIKGNIDSVNSLLFADDEKARQDIRRIIETGKSRGKGFILSTACSIAPMVTKERLLMLSQLVEESGYYEM